MLPVTSRHCTTLFALITLLASGCTAVPQQPTPTTRPVVTPATSSVSIPAGPAVEPTAAEQAIVPLVDAHVHINSLMYAETNFPPILPAVPLPPEIAQLMSSLGTSWGSKATLAPLFTENAISIKSDMNNWYRGRDNVAGFWSQVFSEDFKVIPVTYRADRSVAYLMGYLANAADKDGQPDYLGTAIIVLEKENDGRWRIASLWTRGGIPRLQKPVTAEQYLEELDAAGIQRANILSAAFVFAGSSEVEPGEAAKVREENDWNAQQAARYPDRLTAFCSFNPLKPYALAETESCGRDRRIKGLKFHFSDSRVDLTNPEHLQKVQAVFKLANEHRLAITAHIRTSAANYDPKATTTIFLNELLPLVPDVPVQIAHMTGDSGFGAQAQASFDVLATAIEANDPRTRKLYFDGSGPIAVGRPQSEEDLRTVAAAMRRVGLDRILFASDRHAPNNAPPAESWKAWIEKLPFTEAEFRDIADNVVQYRD